MDLVLTEANTGGYRVHRPNCKRIVDRAQFDPEEISREDLLAASPCSSCKPKEADVEAMYQAPQAPVHPGEAVSEGDGTEPELLDEVDQDGLEPEDLVGVSAADRQVVAPETLTDEERDALAELDDTFNDDGDVFDDLGLDHPTDEEAMDLIGDQAEAEVAVTKHAERKAPKAAPSPKPAKAKDPELKIEEAEALVYKVVHHLGLVLTDFTFPGFGKAIKTPEKQTVYLNSKGTADVRANSPEQAASWVEEGLAERRGGNYVRVNVRAL